MEAPSTASAAAAGASVTAASHGSDLRSLPTVSPSPPKVANPDSAWSGTGAATEESAAEFGSDGKMASVVPQEDAGEPDTKARLQKYARRFRGKGVDAVWLQGRRPLTLLDLPVDILKDIVKEVTHTNDLTSLALCHSALHRLAIPHIYARFDIVWPDTSTHVEPRSGVDALTYGLATLVMAEEIFNRDSNEQRQPLISRNRFNYNGSGPASDLTVRKRRGNHYAQFTRKFSLGNGPPDWVSEYLIYKEGGKMLGTLVALALARMKSLETFVWDMPTGVLRDVWSSLASLGDYKDCRLEKVWVRWHDNSSGRRNMHATTSLPLMNLPGGPLAAAHPSTNAWTHAQRINPAALDHVEHPSFSELPPLKSLSVLDIDELVYLDEMAVLIGKSVEKLTELRVGIARHAGAFSWVTVAEEDGLQQVDYGRPSAASVTIGEKRLGGILGVLTGFVHDLRRPKSGTGDDEPSGTRSTGPRVAGSPFARAQSGTIYSPDTVSSAETTAADEEQASVTLDTDTGSLAQELQALHVDDAVVLDKSTNSTPHATSPSAAPYRANDMLRLDILELERVPLSLLVLDRAIDWTRLTSLTLLHCQGHEMLWRTLRRTFEPVPKSPVYPRPRRSSASTPRRGSRVSHGGEEIEFVYGLNLKKIHINVVSTSLITFLKETLAPNSLEVLFLQEVRMGTPPVTIDSIFRGPLRRHRRSLKKLLIDSSVENHDGLLPASSRWRRWMLTRDIIGFICSGKMPVLQELGVTIDYRDWHFFLRSLPSIPHIRSLYIPYLAHHAHGADLDPRELALQILDIVALRPEVELCYMGVGTKCFEILQDRDDGSRSDGTPMGHRTESDMDDDDEDDVGLGDEDRDEDRDDDGDDDSTESDDDHGLDDNETESETGDDDSDGRGWPGLRLREILFYEDKVAIFKARHGRL